MDCILGSSPLLPFSNASLLANGTSFDAWIVYFARDYLRRETLFDDSATLGSITHTLQACHEWDNVCQDPSQMFANPTNLAVCSLYSNLTTTVSSRPGHVTAPKDLGYMVTTCLVSYCALDPWCSSNATSCSASSLITESGQLSSQGMGRCWWDFCYNSRPYVNSDIGGVGVSQPNKNPAYDLLTASVAHLILDATSNRSSRPYCPGNLSVT